MSLPSDANRTSSAFVSLGSRGKCLDEEAIAQGAAQDAGAQCCYMFENGWRAKDEGGRDETTGLSMRQIIMVTVMAIMLAVRVAVMVVMLIVVMLVWCNGCRNSNHTGGKMSEGCSEGSTTRAPALRYGHTFRLTIAVSAPPVGRQVAGGAGEPGGAHHPAT